MTTGLLPGYLRKNGIPYSEQTTLAEHFDHFSEPDGTEWFTVTTIVTDPVFLGMPFVTTTDFKKEPNGSRFSSEPVLGALTSAAALRELRMLAFDRVCIVLIGAAVGAASAQTPGPFVSVTDEMLQRPDPADWLDVAAHTRLVGP